MEIKLKDVIKRELRARKQSLNSVSIATGIPSSTLHAWSTGQLPSAKNFKHLLALSQHWDLSILQLLLNKNDREGVSILFSTTFVDQDNRYRLILEKIHK